MGNNKTPKSGKATGSKRKLAESSNATNQDDEEPVVQSFKKDSTDYAILVDDNGSPKKVKVERPLRDGPVCKAEDLTEDGVVDLVDDA